MIAEEFPGDEPIRLSHLVDVLETSMLKRIAHGRPFGVAVLAEGIGLRLPQDELAKAMPEIERDEHGHVRLAELELDRLLAKQVRDRFRERGCSVTVEGKNIGYELRCAPPIPFDIEYTRDLGYGAVNYLKRVLEGDEPGGMITIQEGHIVPLPFGSFSDPGTGRVRIRLVNAESSSYRVAREYMIRLDRERPWGSGEAPHAASGSRPRPSAIGTAISSRAEHRPPSRGGREHRLITLRVSWATGRRRSRTPEVRRTPPLGTAGEIGPGVKGYHDRLGDLGCVARLPGRRRRVLGQDVLELRDEAQGLAVLALPDVAAEDQAGRTRFHRLPCLVQHGLVPGALPARRPAAACGSRT